jgi:Domain of unknown function (DUF1707)/Inner membrane component of T3SS, cytoplasmic domain
VGTPGDPRVRVSDADRDQVLARLRESFADGRLTHDTFVGRADAALHARFGGDLRGLVADLPSPRRLRADAAAACRRVLRSAERRLRGWPPALRLPAGPQDRFTIGRELACDMTLADLTVSRWHASLQWDGYSWLLADLGSTNGTRLNGWRVTGPSPVGAGDLVSFGAVTFVLADRPR